MVVNDPRRALIQTAHAVYDLEDEGIIKRLEQRYYGRTRIYKRTTESRH